MNETDFEQAIQHGIYQENGGYFCKCRVFLALNESAAKTSFKRHCLAVSGIGRQPIEETKRYDNSKRSR